MEGGQDDEDASASDNDEAESEGVENFDLNQEESDISDWNAFEEWLTFSNLLSCMPPYISNFHGLDCSQKL